MTFSLVFFYTKGHPVQGSWAIRGRELLLKNECSPYICNTEEMKLFQLHGSGILYFCLSVYVKSCSTQGSGHLAVSLQ